MAEKKEPRISDDVLRKLLLFTAAILVLPVVSFFGLRSLGANAILSGGAAAGVANILLFGYILVAVFEKDPRAVQLESKKKE